MLQYYSKINGHATRPKSEILNLKKIKDMNYLLTIYNSCIGVEYLLNKGVPPI